MVAESSQVSQWPVGRLIDRFGSKPIRILSQVMSLPLMFGLMVVSSFPALAGMYALLGVSAATWVPAQRVILANSSAEREHGEALSRLAAFQGLVGFPAPFIGGLLYDAFGFQAPLLAGIVGIVVTTVMVAVLVKEPTARESSETL